MLYTQDSGNMTYLSRIYSFNYNYDNLNHKLNCNVKAMLLFFMFRFPSDPSNPWQSHICPPWISVREEIYSIPPCFASDKVLFLYSESSILSALEVVGYYVLSSVVYHTWLIASLLVQKRGQC